MRVEYDAKVPMGNRGPYADLFWGFYNSEHETVTILYDEKEDAKKAYQAIFNIISRKKIHDVYVSKRGNTLYLIRNGANVDG